jgi:hypothetical protein
MGRKKVIALVAAILTVFIITMIVGYSSSWFGTQRQKTADREPDKGAAPPATVTPTPTPPPEPPKPKVPEHKEVRGIYLTGNSAGLESRFNHLVDLINSTELNAMVIDILDDNGEVSYKSDVPLVREIGADKSPKIKDIHKVIDTLNKNNIYPIARIVTFKDNVLATKHPELAIKSQDGSVWRDYKKTAWLNPYNKDSWEYPISVAEEAIDMGFKEIQFDYVRFPTDGNRKLINYGPNSQGKTMTDAISGFLAYARERLNKKGAVVSADIYGLVTTVKDDMGIGQHLENVAASVDVMSPMVYPSHYAYGSYGIKYPDLEPYKTVFKSLSTAVQRIGAMQDTVTKAKIRPWLQDFTGAWLRPKTAYKHYTEADVRAQIKAAYDSGLKEWILWNATNKYTESALEKQ